MFRSEEMAKVICLAHGVNCFKYSKVKENFTSKSRCAASFEPWVLSQVLGAVCRRQTVSEVPSALSVLVTWSSQGLKLNPGLEDDPKLSLVAVRVGYARRWMSIHVFLT